MEQFQGYWLWMKRDKETSLHFTCRLFCEIPSLFSMYKLMGRFLQTGRPGAPRNGSPMLRAVTVPGSSRISSLMVATCTGTQNIRD